MPLPDSPDGIIGLGTRELALQILAQLASAQVVNRRNVIAEKIATMPTVPGQPVAPYLRTMNNEPQVARGLAEAWDWLFVHGLISPDPVAGQDNYFITRRGHDVLVDASVLREDW